MISLSTTIFSNSVIITFAKTGPRHDVNFLQNCKTNNVFPKFVKWKNVQYKALRERNKYYARNLNDALDKRRKELKHLETERDKLKVNLVNSIKWMKSQLLLFSIKRLQG